MKGSLRLPFPFMDSTDKSAVAKLWRDELHLSRSLCNFLKDRAETFLQFWINLLNRFPEELPVDLDDFQALFLEFLEGYPFPLQHLIDLPFRDMLDRFQDDGLSIIRDLVLPGFIVEVP